MYKVLIADPISDHGIQQLYDAPDLEVIRKNGLSEAELIEIIPQFDAILVRSQTKVTAAIMESGSRLKVVGRAGVGVDNIDLDAATQTGTIVINAPDGNTISTCEHTFAMMMALSRQIPQAYAKTISGVWDRKSFVGVELHNKTLGIIGMGRIGSEIAKRAKTFGMTVLAFDPYLPESRAEKIGVGLRSVDKILTEADFITVHTPLTADTRHMISTDQFAIMKRGMRIINCARGGIIDEQALVIAIDQGIVAGAAFDVFEDEPPTAEHPFMAHPNVIVSPHLGASTQEAQENVAIDVAEQILHILRDEPFKNAVNIPPVPEAVLKKLQPYFELAETLGSFTAQITEGAFQEINIAYNGDISEVDTTPLTRYIIKGILSRHLGSDVNLVNAMQLAKQRDLNIVVQKEDSSPGSSTIQVRLQPKGQARSVSGTLVPSFGARIIAIDDYPVDIPPKGHILLIGHHDVPGIIGNVGMLLGENQVNIATMQVGRQLIGGSAVMVLTVDHTVPQDVLDKLMTLPQLHTVQSLEL